MKDFRLSSSLAAAPPQKIHHTPARRESSVRTPPASMHPHRRRAIHLHRAVASTPPCNPADEIRDSSLALAPPLPRSLPVQASTSNTSIVRPAQPASWPPAKLKVAALAGHSNLLASIAI